MLTGGYPLYIWIDFQVGPGPDGKTAGFTRGLDALELMELETLNSPEPPGELRERFFGLALYLIENGPAGTSCSLRAVTTAMRSRLSVRCAGKRW
jgi:hypothetical protein